MRDRKFWVMVMGVFVFGVFVFSLVNVGLHFTGFAIFSNSGSDFDDGVYNNTFYNGSGVVLAGTNLSGSYVSEVFDAGGEAVWNNLSWVSQDFSVDSLYAVDGVADVWGSVGGVVWVLVNDDYNGGDGNGATAMVRNSSRSLFVLYGQDLWSSTDSGVSWTKVNDDFNGARSNAGLVMAIDGNDYIYIVDGGDGVFKSTDSGLSFSVVNEIFGEGPNAGAMAVDKSDNLFVIDGTAKVYRSTDSGVSWMKVSDDYNGGVGNDVTDMFSNSFGVLFVLHNQDLWQSTDLGVSWVLVNDDFNGGDLGSGIVIYIDSNDYIYIIDGSEDVYLSTDSGVSFTRLVENINGVSGNVFGLSSLIKFSSLSYYVRSCDDELCLGESWADVDNSSSLGLGDNRYFQYRVGFVSPGVISSILESVVIDYDLVNQAPSVVVIVPEEGNTYGYNESIPLEFFVFDSDGNLDSCWYNVDGGANVSLTGCLNSTFDVGGSGSYVLGVYANDSLGLGASDSVGFSVAVGAPTISLSSPVDGVYLDGGENVQFSFVPTDVDLESCELWGDFGGGFGLNQIDVSPMNGVVNSFYLNLSDGNYLWNVRCNDSVGNFAFDGNKSFYVDSVSPDVSLSQPSGRKISRSVFSSWVVSDASPVSCKYNVYRGESVEVANSSVNCSAGTVNFSVTVDADFVFNFYVSDSVGNNNFKSLSFSVDTSSVVVSPPSSGGSGGGGGGGYFIDSLARLKIDKVSVIVSRGEEKSLSVEVKNTGTTSVNKCSLSGGSFIDSNDVFNIGAGEIVEFRFVLRALEGVEDLEMKVKCLDNVSEVVPLSIEVLKPSLDVSILGIEFGSGSELKVDYSVEPTGNLESVLYFRIFDSDGNVVDEVVENVELISGEVYKGSVVMDVGDAEGGMLKIAISDRNVNFVEEDFIYGGGAGVTGFASLDWSGDFSYIGIILIVFLILAGLLVRRIWKLRKGLKK
ncbi:MAG: hypothetical protein V1889_01875 [archaeon]